MLYNYEIDVTGASREDIDMLQDKLERYMYEPPARVHDIGDVQFMTFESEHPLTNDIINLPPPYRLKD